MRRIRVKNWIRALLVTGMTMFPIVCYGLGRQGQWLYVPGQILLRFEPGAAPADREALLKTLGTARGTFHPDLYRVQLPPATGVEQAVAQLKGNRAVAYAQPNFVYHAALTPCSPADVFYTGPENWPFLKIDAPDGWALFNAGDGCPASPPGSSSVTVAVLDTGISRRHPDLVGVPLNGFNAIHQANGSGPIRDSGGVTVTDDDFGHGTYVAGIIGAAWTSSVVECPSGSTNGMAGLAPGCPLLAVKVLNDPTLPDPGSGTSEEIASGTYFAAVTMGAKVLNFSLAGPSDDPTEKDAINAALAQGSVVVAASGNYPPGPPDVNFPAAYPGVISVGATDPNDQVTSFSCFGPELKLVAPGGVANIGTYDPGHDIFSAMWQCPGPGANPAEFARASDPNFGTAAGTSAAAPFVAGTAALVFSMYPSLNGTQVTQAILDNTDSLNGNSGWDKKTGYGRLNVYKALLYANNPLGAGQATTYLKTFNSPNPFYPDIQAPTNITLVLSQPEAVKLTITDTSGEVVLRKTFSSSELNNNPSNPQYKSFYVPWDGRNGNGQKVKTGVYFYTVESASGVGRNKIALIQGSK